MRSRWLGLLWAGTLGLAGVFACSSDAHDAAGSAGGYATAGADTTPTAGGSNLNGGASGAGAGGVGGVLTASTCSESPPPLRTQGTLLSLQLELVLAGKPFLFGQPNPLADGGSVVPLNVRFYISEVQLLRSGGEEPIAVDVVTAAGVPEPYGVHFFNAEEPASSTLRLLAPPGEYSGLSFAVGIKLSCNQQPPNRLSDPLTDVSQMTWPHAGGFLFLRYEGRYSGAGGAGAAGASSAGVPPAVHMGGDITKELVPTVTVAGGPLSLPGSGAVERRLSVVMEEIFKGATSNIDLGDVSSGLLSAPESQAGERLRRGLPELHVFVLEP
jgi:methanobactin biosynthesis MbnP-like protein